ncbi:DUF4350 domain-containing protein [Actinoplanes siamensis]|uniref:DUF4350 domain-containing protein n=1 Tax=Actinoplanes siamensis TaxID=1223317 RepID=A0A919K7V4_9ACTN|nr:DUF4350 domain-containing protein [Actinoplanes siamensis]GIF02571.1 hypothetical protein Asi03nite_01090 [Actinoplanes siamensis]
MTTRRDRRWLRVAIPFAVLVTLITGTLLVHAAEQPDPADADFLSPASSAGIGSSKLADRLRRRGVAVVRETSTAGALAATSDGDATLLVTTPGLADLDRLSRFDGLPAGTRVVLVGPEQAALARTDWPIRQDGEHLWTTAVIDAGCADPVATAAGPAAVGRLRYATAPCYAGALLTTTWGGLTITAVGAADPFRNDRIDEHGNGALAAGLLARTSRVVWLDVHHRDVQPSPSPSPSSRSTETPFAGPSTGQTPRETGAPGDPGDAAPADRAQGPDQPNPLAEAFPPALWATLALLGLALLALAAAAARRLGTPVAEPLPSRVPADETMLGHARLYQRAHAREESLDILRAAARRRITAHLGLPAGATVEDIAESAGYQVDDVREVLAGFRPDNDAELVSAANAVQHLVREITGFEGDQP